jgi:hypothetical protein
MPSPPTRRLAFGLDLGPSGTYSCVLHLAPLSAEAFGCVIGASFGAGLPLPLTPGLSLLSFCRLALGLCVLVFLRALCLSAICIIDTSVDQLYGSLHESAKCAHAAQRHSGSTLWPESGSAKPASGCLMAALTPPPPPVPSKSCGLQGDKAGRQVYPLERRTPHPYAVLKVQMRKAYGTQDVRVLFVREYLVAPALPKRVMVSDRPHLPGLLRVGVLNHPYRWLTWTVKPVSPPSSTGRPSIRVSGCGVAEV